MCSCSFLKIRITSVHKRNKSVTRRITTAAGALRRQTKEDPGDAVGARWDAKPCLGGGQGDRLANYEVRGSVYCMHNVISINFFCILGATAPMITSRSTHGDKSTPLKIGIMELGKEFFKKAGRVTYSVAPKFNIIKRRIFSTASLLQVLFRIKRTPPAVYLWRDRRSFTMSSLPAKNRHQTKYSVPSEKFITQHPQITWYNWYWKDKQLFQGPSMTVIYRLFWTFKVDCDRRFVELLYIALALRHNSRGVLSHGGDAERLYRQTLAI